MAEFCTCGSLKIKGSCSNKKCINHIKDFAMATGRQIDYIEDLLQKLKDSTKYNFRVMTEKEASKLIGELEERLELDEGEKDSDY